MAKWVPHGSRRESQIAQWERSVTPNAPRTDDEITLPLLPKRVKGSFHR